MIVIAHRGASGLEPENTLRAFRRAVRLKCRWIECDVRITKDGVPIIIHDATVNRTTNGRGSVSRMTNDELRKLDAGRGETIPTLKETLQFAKKNRTQLVLEIKDPRALKKTVALIHAHKLTSSIIVSSFFPAVVRRAKQLMPSLTAALIIERPNIDWMRAAHRARADLIHVSARLVTKKQVSAAHSTGLIVWAWVINTKKYLTIMKAMEINGIFTDCPDLFKEDFT